MIRYIQIFRKSILIRKSKMAEYILKVGRKGEIYTPKKLRLRIGLSPGNEIIAITKGNKILLNERRLLEKELLER